MRFHLPAVLLGLAASASAQDTNQTGPFYLHITGQGNSSIDGYAASCHAGAAIEGLCYAEGPRPDSTSFEYYFNYTGSTTVGDSNVGIISWHLPVVINGTQTQVPQTLNFQYQPSTNVAAPMFGIGTYSGGTSVGFDADGKLFTYTYYDDSTFVPGQNPTPTGEAKALYQWFVCWQYFTGYYYQSVGWAQSLPPHNPTCEPVDITQVFP
ncbi:hypothetical protein F4779DRAFT_578281 [Xylariaceae sp. FL0662B]|nr:hypothetical protein F4779DRAFT_578281 [Xylariaceae sp. FL0662B]